VTSHVHLVPSLAGAAAGSEVVVEGAEAHHAVAVRRIAVGEELVLTDGAGAWARCEVATTAKQRLVATVLEVERTPEPTPAVEVVQALPKGERGELAVEVLTEIGVARVVPWAASRSVAVWRGERAAKSLGKWRATAREAAKQARRSWHPRVDELAGTEAVAAHLAAAPLALVLHEEATASLAEAMAEALADGVPERVVLVVGPEGGLAPDELAAFEAVGARTVRLGDEVLRTSTAGLAAVSAVLSRTGRWGAPPG